MRTFFPAVRGVGISHALCWFAMAAIVASSLLASCAPVRSLVGRDDSPRRHALLLNGGGGRAANYASHVEHLKGVLAVLEKAGFDRRDITIFASDGENPAPDLATRESVVAAGRSPRHPRLGRPPIRYINTEVDGMPLRPATTVALAEYFESEAPDLRPGDTLFVYVTDHGTRGGEGPRSNRISLWKGEHLSVDAFSALLDRVPEGVRIVMLMSQCYSGGFAWLVGNAGAGELPDGEMCGYFSATEDRLAYGCYAENRGDAGVGHSIRFLEALQSGGSFSRAHRLTLVNDQTPDVPLRTSDVQFELLLETAAREKGQAASDYVDQLLLVAWANPERWEREIRLLDRIGQAFGFASPRQLSDVEGRLDALPRVSTPLNEHAKAWDRTRADAEIAIFERFGKAHPDLAARLRPSDLSKLSKEERAVLQDDFEASFVPWLDEHGDDEERLVTLRSRSAMARAVAYRMKVREAALERLRAVLLQVAGRVHLERGGTVAEREAFDALVACEEFSLDLPVVRDAEDFKPRLFPPYGDDVTAARQVLPAWMGIRFQAAEVALREEKGLTPGAVSIRYVYEGSPAELAGLRVGDVVLGPPGAPFEEPKQIREWTMFQRAGQARNLVILRDGREITITLVPGEHPGKFPELPQPPKVGDLAPQLKLEDYRLEAPTTLVGTRRHLLFFWATWCLPCKAALPELMAWAKQTDVEVIAITDEAPARLDAFFADGNPEFPEIVARDPYRATTLSYGVSGTPTLVLVGADGRVVAYEIGYSSSKGLKLPR